MEIPKWEDIDVLITRETDYALRILRALTDGTQKNTTEICKVEMISQQFAYKILKKLKDAGLIKIARGTDGRCQLIADLKKINLYELIEIMDKSNEISACLDKDFNCKRHTQSGDICRIHTSLTQVQEVLDDELRRHTLHQMLCIK